MHVQADSSGDAKDRRGRPVTTSKLPVHRNAANPLPKMKRINRFLPTFVASIVITIAGFSQTAPTPALPVQRVLTDTLGRKLDSTILEKSPTAIKCRRNPDGAEFTIELSKLSADDRKFLADLGKPAVAPPPSKPKTEPVITPPKPVPATPAPWVPFDYTLTINGKIERKLRLDPKNTDYAKIQAYENAYTPNANNRRTVGVTICGQIGDETLIVTNTQGLDTKSRPYNDLSEEDRKFLKDTSSIPPIRENPFPYTLTLTDGRKLEGTICGVNKISVLVRRATDNKEIGIALTKLSVKDRKVIAGMQVGGGGSDSLPLQIDITCKDGRKLDVTILKRSGKDKTAFTCKETKDGKMFDIEFYELAAETQRQLAWVHTQEPTTFPVVYNLTRKELDSISAWWIMEKTATTIRCIEIHNPSTRGGITLQISNLEKKDQDFLAAPYIDLSGIPRRFRDKVTIGWAETIGIEPAEIPAGEVVWAEEESLRMITPVFHGMGRLQNKEVHNGDPRKLGYDIVSRQSGYDINARPYNKEVRELAGETVYILKEDATSMIVETEKHGVLEFQKPGAGTKEVDAKTADYDGPFLADPPPGK